MGKVRRISKKYFFRQIVTFFLVYCLFFNPAVLAEVVLTGQEPGSGITVTPLGTGTTQDMTADNNGAIGYFSDFDIALNHTVNCVQGNSAYNALFKVDSATNSTPGTQIYGTFTSNGNIYFQDTYGIFIGENGVINTNQFVASTLNINNEDWQDFIAGVAEQLQFAKGYEDPFGVVENQGTITALTNVYLVGSRVINSGTIIAPDTLVMAAGDKVYLKQDGSKVVVDVDVEMNFSPNHVVDNDGTIEAPDGKVILAAGDIFSAALDVGSLAAKANRNITMEGDVTTVGDTSLIADSDLDQGGDVTANGAITAGGKVDIAGNIIQLNDNVTANNGDLTITGRTSKGMVLDDFTVGPEPEGYWGYIDVAATENPEGTKLYASHDVKLIDAFGSGGEEHPAGKMDLFGHGSLTIEAKGGEIITQNLSGDTRDRVKITVEDLSPASLTMKQADPLNLADYSFGNQANTDLTLVSHNGSVTAVDSSQLLSGKNENAADQWASITATAYTDITLQGHDAGRDITAGVLTSYATDFDTGNITVTSDNSQVLLTDDVIAYQGSIAITAIDPDNGGIESGGDILASDGITLFGEVTADYEGDQTFDAGNGALWAKDTLSTITKTTEGGLTLGGDTLVDLDGIEDSVWVQAGPLTIEDSLDAEGNLKAQGTIHLQGTTNNVAGDILSTGSGIIIDNDLDADGVGSQLFDAGSGQLIAENSADIDKSTTGSLTLAGDTGIVLGGNVTGTGMESGDKLVFENDVYANGTGDAEDQRFDAELGALDADGSIAKTTDGKLNLGGDEGIALGGNVETQDGDLTFEDAVTADGGDQRFDAGTSWHSWGNDLVAADDIIKTTDGSLTLDGGRGDTDSEIYLAGNVETHAGNLIFEDKVVANGTGDQSFDAGTSWHSWGNDLIAEQDIIKTTDGSLTLDGGRGDTDSEIYLAGNVETTDGDLTFEDKVIANGSGNQRFDAVGGELWAQQTITKTSSGDLNLGGDDAIDLDGTVDVDAGSLTIEDDFAAAADLIASENVTLEGAATLDGSVNQKIEAENGKLYAKDSVHKTEVGRLDMIGGFDGPLGSDDYSVKTKDVAVDEGALYITGNAFVLLDGDLYSTGRMELTSNADGDEIGVDAGTLEHASGTIKSVNDDVDMAAINSRILLHGGAAYDPLYPDDNIYVSAGGDILLYSSTSVAGNRKLDAGDDVALAANKRILSDGSLTIEAGEDILLGIYDVTHHWSNQGSGYGGDVTVNGNLTLDAGDDVYAHGDLISNNGSIDIYSSNWTTYLWGDLLAAYDVTLNNNTVLKGYDDQTIAAAQAEEGYGTLTAEGFVWKTTPGNLYLYGDNPGTDAISLNNNCDSECSMLTCLPAASTCSGNLELYAKNGDIQISGDLTTFWECYYGNDDGPTIATSGFNGYLAGGVSVIAENGKIYTEGASPENDTLNIGIVGNSDDVSHRVVCENGGDYIEVRMEPLGVDLPYGEGKAAIVVLSSEDLKFGPDTMLIARGNYDDSVVDDRSGVGFLADPLTAIGGIIRDEGDPIDVAVYVGSMGTDDGQGNVHLDGRAIDVAQNGTMVVDAYDTVTFGDFDTFNLENLEGCKDLSCFFIKLALRFQEENLCEAFGEYVELNGWYEGVLEDFLNDTYDEDFFFNIDRLEVVSRITEWLSQAPGLLPFAGDAAGIAAVEDFIGGDYILRGAGLGRPDITDGRAWVLEYPLPAPPLFTETGQASEEQEFAEGGCPPLMNWLAGEIGVPAEDIQVVVADALALNTDIQPCEMCARLMEASKSLQDVDGTRIAAMAQVVNEFVTTPAPPSEEQMTSIAAALAEHVGDGTHYAAAGQWIDALVAYIGIMNTEMGYSASDATAFAQKYLAPVTDTGNVALIAYVQARLAALGG